MRKSTRYIGAISVVIFLILAFFVAAWVVGDNLTNALLLSLLFAFFLPLSLLILIYIFQSNLQVTDFYNKLETFLATLTGYKKKYLEHIYYKYRAFETRGLTVQGDFNLELEKVYVELKMSNEDLYAGTEGSAEKDAEESTIWEYTGVDPKGNQGHFYVVIGTAGCGKTTLLKQMALVLSKRRKYLMTVPNLPDKIPILLTLREHSRAIEINPALTLSEAIENSLAKMKNAFPRDWFDTQLRKGRCFIMMDGLDEIADSKARPLIVEWVQKQMNNLPKNIFLITSRPHGYQDNPLENVTELRISPFSRNQVKQFIHNWYLANEIMRSQQDDPGVRMKAEERADDLVKRLDLRPVLSVLAENPLLATMIATVHSFKGVLPGRRVELYGDIFDVFLRRRIEIWQDVQLSSAQILEVLKPLAYFMIERGYRVIPKMEALQIVEKELAKTGSNVTGDDFLKNVEDQSGLLLEAEVNIYSFAHLTFQEYLASTFIFEDRTGELQLKLLERIDDGWWAETIRLFAAQADATNIIAACLKQIPPQITSLSLAIDCVTEALKIEPSIRHKITRILDQSIESDITETRALAAEAKLSSRLRWMHRLKENQYIDEGLISNVEYQLFLDETGKKHEYYYPDQWTDNHFPSGLGKQPVLGIRPSDAVHFCEWLTARDIWYARYRLPRKDEIGPKIESPEEAQVKYWLASEATASLPVELDATPQHISILMQTIKNQIEDDFERLMRLKEALTRRGTSRRKTEELITYHGIAPVADGMASPSMIGSVRELEIDMQVRKYFENGTLLQWYEAGSNLLNLELHRLIDEVIKNKRTSPLSNWFPDKLLFFLEKFDIESSYNAGVCFFENDYVRNNPDLIFFSDTLHESIRILKSRSWAGNDYQDPRYRKITYEFMRWYARTCVNQIACLVSNRLPKHQELNAERRQIMSICTDLIVHLVILEERIKGKMHANEGLRVVKISSS